MSRENPKRKFGLLRKVVLIQQQVAKYWNAYSGDWHWLSDNPMSVKGLNRKLWRAAVPTMSFCVLVSLSALISTLGLLANSVATIIGAMIVAPLMGPIIGTAYALVVGNRRLLKRAIMTTLVGSILCILFSMIIAYPLSFKNFGSEILVRVRPSLLDLGVALAAGAVGSFATSRKHIADALPGVAIAVALVPPLSVVGIGLSAADYQIAGGALLLYVTNLIGIIFSGSLVFLIQEYGSIHHAKKGLVAGLLSVFLLVIPLGFSLRNILIRETVHREVSDLLKRRTLTFQDVSIESLKTQVLSDGGLEVNLEVIAQGGKVTLTQIKFVKQFLSDQLNRPVRVKVKVIPADFFEG